MMIKYNNKSKFILSINSKVAGFNRANKQTKKIENNFLDLIFEH